MTLTILDPCTGNRITIEVVDTPQPTRSVRRKVLLAWDQGRAEKRPCTVRT